MKAKYIVVKQGNIEVPFVFSELSQHADVAFAVSGSVLNVVGAGFCHIAKDRYHCYGESYSCKVKSRYEEDSKVLNKLLGVDYD
jgi:hypothetical protein